MEIVWLGHGSFELRIDGKIVLLDPWFENPKYPSGHTVSKCDAILITHGHSDHIGSVIDLAKKFKPKVVANFEIVTWLGSKGVANGIGMNKGGTVDAGPVKVTMTNAVHSSTIDDGGKMIPAGEPCSYVLHLPTSKTIYFAGDTAVHSDMALVKRLYAPELAFLPIGDLFTMDPKQAALATELLGVKTVVPMHYGTFPPLTGSPEEFQKLVASQGVKVQALKPGEPWTY